MSKAPQWIKWARALQALAQSGLTYSESEYEIERYEAVRKIAAEIMESHSTQTAEQWVALFDLEKGYATPKVDTRGVVFRDNEILLVLEHVDGKWTLPGGWADVSLSPSENVQREVFEESGFLTRATRLLAVYDRSKHPHVPLYPFHIYKLFFLCEITGGKAAISHETDDVRFFARDAIPELSLSRVTHAQIERMFVLRDNPLIPTDFD